LGLISSTSQGAEILDDYHWEATLTPMGMPTGLCIPINFDRFISVCFRFLRVEFVLTKTPAATLGSNNIGTNAYANNATYL